ncbi:MAG: hypothetical protein CMC81_06590 [Flavobacteriaceae bacterium]|nr:hypothetical protein [Flavobacteriaceae bacterium]|tara:strand:+ start:798 stop:1571 length:774 start_codon:yes stop_codon:yes gene_type:complete
MRTTFLVLILFSFIKLNAQNKRSFLLKGNVLVSDSLSISSIHVINKSRGSATITNEFGYFELFSSTNDTIIFSSVQYKLKILVVSQEILETKKIIVPLETFVNELSEVIVKPHNLSGDLFNDIANSTTKPINFYNLGIPGFTGKRKEKIISPTSIIATAILSGNIPVDPIYKYISGYYKNLKKKRSLEIDFNLISNLIKFYGFEYFKTSFGLREEEIYDFVSGTYDNYPVKETFINNEHNKVINFFEENYKRILGSK